MAREWFYFDNAKLIGPFTDAGLKVLVQEKVILPETILKTGDRQCFAGDVRGLFPSPVLEPVLNPKPRPTPRPRPNPLPGFDAAKRQLSLLASWARTHFRLVLFRVLMACFLLILMFMLTLRSEIHGLQKDVVAQRIQFSEIISELENQKNKLASSNEYLAAIADNLRLDIQVLESDAKLRAYGIRELQTSNSELQKQVTEARDAIIKTGKGATLAKFNLIKMDMSKFEVEQIMGQDGTVVSESNFYNSHSLTVEWERGGDSYAVMSISFNNGRVATKNQHGLE